jgi:WD40 repeat protein
MAPKTKSPKKGQQKERSKHINVNSKQTIAAITELRNRNEGDVYMRVNVASHFRKICRTITNHSCWINAVSTSSKYVPMLQRTLMDDELRMRSVGASGSSGPTVAVFDLETGKTLFMIEGHETVVYSIAISSPHYDSGTNPVLVTGSHDGFMKVWELKTGLMLLDLGKNIHKGPVRAVCVIEGRLPTIYSGSNNEVRIDVFIEVFIYILIFLIYYYTLCLCIGICMVIRNWRFNYKT